MKLGTYTKETKLDKVLIVGNIETGAFVALDFEGQALYRQIKDGHEINYDELNENERAVYNALIEYAIVTDKNIVNTSEIEIKAAYLHVTDRCNYHCKGCYSYIDCRNAKKDLTLEQLVYIMKELKKSGVERLVISGGEPFIRNDMPEILNIAKHDIGFENITVGSNGTYINEDIITRIKDSVDELAIAIDGFDNEHDRFIRDKGSFDISIRAIKLAKAGGVNVSMLPTVHKKNYFNINEYVKLAKQLEVSISFSVLTCDVESCIFNDYVLDCDEMQSMMNKCNENIIIQDMITSFNDLNFKDSCGAGKSFISISANGDVYPCHMLHYDELKLGNIFKSSLSDMISVYSKKRFENFSVDNKKQCKNCSYRYFCGGGCAARVFGVNKSFDAKDTYCKAYMDNFERFNEYVNSLI